jgi:hypothetical protein
LNGGTCAGAARESFVGPATRLNNDADADASQGPLTGKSRKLYRAATLQKILPTHRNKSSHACAILRTSIADPRDPASYAAMHHNDHALQFLEADAAILTAEACATFRSEQRRGIRSPFDVSAAIGVASTNCSL